MVSRKELAQKLSRLGLNANSVEKGYPTLSELHRTMVYVLTQLLNHARPPTNATIF